MKPDYFHNPPNFICHTPPPPPEPLPPSIRNAGKSYYIVLFVNSKNLDEKGQAIVYRRKTLDMLFDLIGDIDEQYYHTLYDNNDLVFLDQETRNENVFFRILYTNNVKDVYKVINPNGYVVRFDWQDIPNTNYPNQWHVHSFPFPHRAPKPKPHPVGAPPMPSEYVGTQHDLANEICQRFGDQQDL